MSQALLTFDGIDCDVCGRPYPVYRSPRDGLDGLHGQALVNAAWAQARRSGWVRTDAGKARCPGAAARYGTGPAPDIAGWHAQLRASWR